MRRSSQAQRTTEATKAAVPSTVFDVPGHRVRPTSLPTIEACGCKVSSESSAASILSTTHQAIADAKHEHAREPVDALPLQPDPASAAGQQVKVADDDRPVVLRVDELGEEDVEGCADRV